MNNRKPNRKRKKVSLKTSKKTSENIYLKMPLERVRADALHGVSLARLAWRERDPNGSAFALGQVMVKQGKRRKNEL